MIRDRQPKGQFEINAVRRVNPGCRETDVPVVRGTRGNLTESGVAVIIIEFFRIGMAYGAQRKFFSDDTNCACQNQGGMTQWEACWNRAPQMA